MFEPHPRRFRTSQRIDPGRYPIRRYARRLPDLSEAEPEPSPVQPAHDQPWRQPKELPILAGKADPLPLPAPPPEQGIGRIIVTSILIMTVVILWAAWGVASLNGGLS
jgi:hypothetical protein